MTREELCAKKEEALAAFGKNGPFPSCEPYGNGHINDTFLAISQSGRRYILQRINHMIFTRPDEIMENILAVTEHIRKKGEAEGLDTERCTLSVVKTDGGDSFYKDSIGSFWRMYDFCEHTVAKEKVSCKKEFTDCAEAFGKFQGQLADFDASVLHEAIKNFHNTPVRYENLMRAAKKDICGRAAEVQKEIQFAMERAEFVKVLENARANGSLPLRVTHNDTKLNNILFDAATNEGICVIDLDTVMPGLSINDFGDSIRFGANHCAEDEKDLSRMYIDLDLFDVYAKAYIEGAEGSLTDAEVEYMPWGAKLMTLECGIRFLTDYLVGDTYFRTHREGQNLDRCRTQFKLVADMEAHWDEMNAIVARYRA